MTSEGGVDDAPIKAAIHPLVSQIHESNPDIPQIKREFAIDGFIGSLNIHCDPKFVVKLRADNLPELEKLALLPNIQARVELETTSTLTGKNLYWGGHHEGERVVEKLIPPPSYDEEISGPLGYTIKVSGEGIFISDQMFYCGGFLNNYFHDTTGKAKCKVNFQYMYTGCFMNGRKEGKGKVERYVESEKKYVLCYEGTFHNNRYYNGNIFSVSSGTATQGRKLCSYSAGTLVGKCVEGHFVIQQVDPNKKLSRVELLRIRKAAPKTVQTLLVSRIRDLRAHHPSGPDTPPPPFPNQGGLSALFPVDSATSLNTMSSSSSPPSPASPPPPLLKDINEKLEDIQQHTIPHVEKNILLNSKKKYLSLNESIDALCACFRVGKENAVKKVKGKDLISIVGNNGVGKSTLINFLSGCTMVKSFNKRDQVGQVPSSGIKEDSATSSESLSYHCEVLPVEKGGALNEVIPIRHRESQAANLKFLPEVVTVPLSSNSSNNEATHENNASSTTTTNNIVFCDCPLFKENRGAILNVANAGCIHQCLTEAKSVIIVMLITFDDLQSNDRNLHELLHLVSKLFSDTSSFKALIDSVVLCVNQVPSPYREDISSLKKLIIELDEKQTPSSMLTSLLDRLIIFDPFHNEEPATMTESDKNMMNKKRISNSSSREDFMYMLESTPTIRSDVYRAEVLNSDLHQVILIVEQIRSKIQRALDEGSFEDASNLLSDLKNFRILDRVAMDRVVDLTTFHVDNFFKTMILEFNTSCHFGVFEDCEYLIDEMKFTIKFFGEELEQMLDVKHKENMLIQAKLTAEKNSNREKLGPSEVEKSKTLPQAQRWLKLRQLLDADMKWSREQLDIHCKTKLAWCDEMTKAIEEGGLTYLNVIDVFQAEIKERLKNIKEECYVSKIQELAKLDKEQNRKKFENMEENAKNEINELDIRGETAKLEEYYVLRMKEMDAERQQLVDGYESTIKMRDDRLEKEIKRMQDELSNKVKGIDIF